MLNVCMHTELMFYAKNADRVFTICVFFVKILCENCQTWGGFRIFNSQGLVSFCQQDESGANLEFFLFILRHTTVSFFFKLINE